MPDGSIQLLDRNAVMGSGDYVITLHVAHCYIGPHKGGETFSVSIQVVGILHRPRVEEDDDIDVFDLLHSFAQSVDDPPALDASQDETQLNTFISPKKPSPVIQKVQKKKKNGLQWFLNYDLNSIKLSLSLVCVSIHFGDDLS